jgi:hypothetical protein
VWCLCPFKEPGEEVFPAPRRCSISGSSRALIKFLVSLRARNMLVSVLGQSRASKLSCIGIHSPQDFFSADCESVINALDVTSAEVASLKASVAAV